MTTELRGTMDCACGPILPPTPSSPPSAPAAWASSSKTAFLPPTNASPSSRSGAWRRTTTRKLLNLRFLRVSTTQPPCCPQSPPPNNFFFRETYDTACLCFDARTLLPPEKTRTFLDNTSPPRMHALPTRHFFYPAPPSPFLLANTLLWCARSLRRFGTSDTAQPLCTFVSSKRRRRRRNHRPLSTKLMLALLNLERPLWMPSFIWVWRTWARWFLETTPPRARLLTCSARPRAKKWRSLLPTTALSSPRRCVCSPLTARVEVRSSSRRKFCL
mmetsp:Transcript_18269/g.56006  ORF Transcript_18269/g.56006 Transcript_18269/m.56006 type:complete len:273 (-) Transcript_18269:657-1475(-)